MRPSNVGIVIGSVLSSGRFGAGHEGEIMCFEENLCHFDRGSDHNREGPETKMHNGAVFFGEFMNGLVGQRANQVEISDQWPRLRSGGKIELAAAETAGEEEEGQSGYPSSCIRKKPRRKLNVHGEKWRRMWKRKGLVIVVIGDGGYLMRFQSDINRHGN